MAAPASDAHVYAVIMAGGSGTRFWPVSRGTRPKQLTGLLGADTMIQLTVARLAPYVPAERILVITTEAIVAETRRQLPQVPPAQVIAEPVGRDTAPCVALAAEIVHHLDPEGVMILLPADQLISPAERFQQVLAAGVAQARQGGLVTYGIEPRHPATGYGYIQVGESLGGDGDVPVNRVARFVEKPDAATAENYLADGGYRWNSGIFTWRADVVRRELATHVAWLTDALGPVGESFGSDDFEQRLAEVYPGLKKISVDYALMENATDIAVVTADFSWDDVGSWDALYDHLDPDADGNRCRGDHILMDSSGSMVVNEDGPLITGIGLRDLLVIGTPDAVLIVPKGESQAVKALVGRLKDEDRDDLL